MKKKKKFILLMRNNYRVIFNIFKDDRVFSMPISN